jgi:hypothetical protein
MESVCSFFISNLLALKLVNFSCEPEHMAKTKRIPVPTSKTYEFIRLPQETMAQIIGKREIMLRPADTTLIFKHLVHIIDELYPVKKTISPSFMKWKNAGL